MSKSGSHDVVGQVVLIVCTPSCEADAPRDLGASLSHSRGRGVCLKSVSADWHQGALLPGKPMFEHNFFAHREGLVHLAFMCKGAALWRAGGGLLAQTKGKDFKTMSLRFGKLSARGRFVRAAALASVGVWLGAGVPAQAADLDYDAPRYGSLKDYYGDREPDWRQRRSARNDCVPREFVREELRADGWRDFRDPRPRGDLFVVEARRKRSGRLFVLSIDRCSGDVLAARPLAPAYRAYLRPFHDDEWHWRGLRGWRDRVDWRDDRWVDGRWRHRGAY